jgi:gluconolactonase
VSPPAVYPADCRYPPTDEIFFVQNAGAMAAGTGLAKSAIIEKIQLSQAASAAAEGKRNATGVVKVMTVDSTPQIINPNGGSMTVPR